MTPSVAEITSQVESILNSHGLKDESSYLQSVLQGDVTIQAAQLTFSDVEDQLFRTNKLAAFQLHQVSYQALNGQSPMKYTAWLDHHVAKHDESSPDRSRYRPSGMGDRSQMRSALTTMIQKLTIDSRRAEMTGTFEESFDPLNDLRQQR